MAALDMQLLREAELHTRDLANTAHLVAVLNDMWRSTMKAADKDECVDAVYRRLRSDVFRSKVS